MKFNEEMKEFEDKEVISISLINEKKDEHGRL